MSTLPAGGEGISSIKLQMTLSNGISDLNMTIIMMISIQFLTLLQYFIQFFCVRKIALNG
jgi:hypothetical protein